MKLNRMHNNIITIKTRRIVNHKKASLFLNARNDAKFLKEKRKRLNKDGKLKAIQNMMRCFLKK
jgi:hypothetical protein